MTELPVCEFFLTAVVEDGTKWWH